MISLTVDSTTVVLPDDLYWSDENDWSPVDQSVSVTITGALIVSSAARIAGRPITLASSNDSAWIKRADLDTLRNWGAGPGQVMSLTLRGSTRDVIFRHHEAPALTAVPVVQYSDVNAADNYVVSLRLMEI